MITYMWNPENETNDFIHKIETDSQTKQIYGYQMGNRGRGKLGVWD